MEKSKMLSTRVSINTHKKITKFKKKTFIPKRHIIEKAINNYIDNYEEIR